MMYRRLECTTWDDPWFSELPPEAKLLFLYLITNRRTTACGAFEITLRAIAFETGLPNVETTLAMLGERVVWWPQHQVVFIRNFYRWQSDNTNKGNFRIGAKRALAEFTPDVIATVTHVYPELIDEQVSHPQPIPNPSPTHGEEETVTVTVKETEKETVLEPEPEKKLAKTADKPPQDGERPFDLFVALCDGLGADPSAISGAEKSKQLGKAKQLLAKGMTADDVERCSSWLVSQSWITSGIDLFIVEKFRSRWELAGKPSLAVTKLQDKPASKNGRVGIGAVTELVRKGAQQHETRGLGEGVADDSGRLAVHDDSGREPGTDGGYLDARFRAI
jgi:hypothetical protein